MRVFVLYCFTLNVEELLLDATRLQCQAACCSRVRAREKEVKACMHWCKPMHWTLHEQSGGVARLKWGR